jgi:hypothetical protein
MSVQTIIFALVENLPAALDGRAIAQKSSAWQKLH